MKAALQFARSRLSTMGLVEWTDALNFANIPRTLLDTSFHLEIGAALNEAEHQDNIHIGVPLVVRLFHSGYVDTGTARDVALDRSEQVIDDFISAPNRLNFPGIWNVKFESMEFAPFEATDDNVFLITVSFTVLVIKKTR